MARLKNPWGPAYDSEAAYYQRVALSYRAALIRIESIDFRGPRPVEGQIAQAALDAADAMIITFDPPPKSWP